MVDLVGIISNQLYSPSGRELISRKTTDALKSGKSIDGFSDKNIHSAAQVLSNEIAQAVPPALGGTYFADVSVDRNGDTWSIGIDIYDDELYRPSLNPAKYGGVDNIYTLFIRGYDYSPKWGPVGIWHGRSTYALNKRLATPFVESAVESWVARYGNELNILDYSIDTQYR